MTMDSLNNEAPPSPKPNWVFWSTSATVQNEVPSVTAIVETIVAVPLYWWIAVHVGVVLPLLVSAAIAPLVLLRSDQSVELGVKWFDRVERALTLDNISFNVSGRVALSAIGLLSVAVAASATWLVFQADIRHSVWTAAIISFLAIAVITFYSLIYVTIPVLPQALRAILANEPSNKLVKVLHGGGLLVTFPFGLLLLSLAVRIGATCVYPREGIRNLPRNFRRLIFCSSPAQVPELLPGLSAESHFSFTGLRKRVFDTDAFFKARAMKGALFALWVSIMFAPAWLYRITIKSTAWFWWPLAFLGGDLRQATNPKLFRWKLMGRFWAWVTILISCLSLLAFLAVNLLLNGAIFQGNPLLTPLGYLLLIDWSPQYWQISALTLSVLSIALVLLVNDADGEYRIAQESNDAALLAVAKRKLGWIERLARLRLLCAIVFWVLVGTQALLYVNGQKCWFEPSPAVREWAPTIFGSRLPPSTCGT